MNSAIRNDKMINVTENEYKTVVGKPERKRAVSRTTSRWEDNIKIFLWEIELMWIGFIWLRIGSGG
jgi:hypothetical protein